MTCISTAGNATIEGEEKTPENTEREPMGKKSMVTDDDNTPNLNCMKCEDPSIEYEAENCMPIEEESDEEIKS